jgi:hypothetical protein
MDGRRRAEGSAEGAAEHWAGLVDRLAADLEAQGASQIIAETRAALLGEGGARSEP